MIQGGTAGQTSDEKDAADPDAAPMPDGLSLLQMLASAADAIIIIDVGHRIRVMNPVAQALFGLQDHDILGADITRILPAGLPDPPASEGVPVPDALPTGFRSLGRRADGSDFPIRIGLGTTAPGDRRFRMLVVRDATIRSAEAWSLTRLGKLSEARSRIHRLIMDKPPGQDLLQSVCDALVLGGTLKLAWVGWRLPEAEELICVAEAGEGAGYPRDIKIFLDDRMDGFGPSGQSFRLGAPQVLHDVMLVSPAAPWREKYIESGFRSSAAVPIRLRGTLAGTLNVYSDQVGFFRDAELNLLRDVAEEMSIALDRLALEDVRNRAEAAARRERHFSDAMLESIPGVLYLYTEEGRFLRWNTTFEKVTGYSGDEIRHMRPADFFVPEERAFLHDQIRAVFDIGYAAMEGSFRRKDGQTIPYYFTGQRTVFNGLRCLVGVGIDISAVRQAQNALLESERRYRDTLDNILEACQIVDFNWRYVYLNEAASRQNRRPNDDLLGRTMTDCWPGIEDTEVHRLIRTCMDQRVPVTAEISFDFPDGTSGWFDLRIHPVPEGVFLLSVDVTERHHAEARLHALNADLEHQIARRTEELKVALDRAEQSDRTKSVFLATMSHELRTPLNSIIGFTGIMMQGLAGPLNPEQSKQMGMVQSSARHLLALVNDVLDISKIEAGELIVAMQPVDVRAVIDRIALLFAAEAEKARLWLRVDWRCENPCVMGDRRRVEQVLINLVNNAIKFTETGGVTIVVGAGEGAGNASTDRLTIAVHDTGIGIKPADLAGLFEPFRQVDSSSARQREGTGLGLAICRRLVHLMGGSIGVESEYGRGSVFSVTLPLTDREPE